ncbi:acetolactate synthase small subunit [Paenibacillus sp. MBLB4367]|uniref:acetolactate synthase small subunit n=1 Tax=Paenibacillus sp. MBLB4367 TaxID=3384767 RepID=UPI003907FC6C
MAKHTISVLVSDRPGVLQRIAGLFARRGCNMESLTVGASEQEGMARMVIVLNDEERMLEQMCKQLDKLIDVIRVEPLQRQRMVARELMLVKLRAEPAARPEIFGMIEAFRCSAVDVGLRTVVIQVAGDTDKNDALLQLLRPYGILELTRTGETAMNRGE